MMACKVTSAVLALWGAAFASGGTASGLLFEPNVGQTSSAVSFFAQWPGHALFLTPTGATLRTADSVWKMDLIGANPKAEALGLGLLQTQAHYLIGNVERWHVGVPSYSRVEYRDIYPGVNLVYYGDRGQLKYDLEIDPGADPSQITLHFEGTEPVRFDTNGDLLLRTPQGEWRHTSSEAHQDRNGTRTQVAGQFTAVGPYEVTFAVGRYNRLQPLSMTFSTYLGGSGQDSAAAIAADASGNSYVAGWTESTDFPEAAGKRLGNPNGVDAYVAKLSPAGNLLYVTYLGGSGDDRAFGIAVDSSGSPVVAGWTTSANFPIVNAAQPVLGGGKDGFVAKLNAAGNALLFSTYLGGSGADSANAVALDAQANVYVAGETTSANFPVLNPLQAQIAGGDDAFVAKFSSTGTRLYGTFLGGIGDDRATAIAVDGSGYAYITGSTYSLNFPVVNAFQAKLGGGQDAFAAKIAPSGNSLIYSTYLGGSGGAVSAPETGNGIAVDSTGCAYIAGATSSSNFPTVSPLQASLNGSEDAFVLKLSAAGNALIYSTYLGGSSIDIATVIAIDSTGRAYVAGYTASTDFPVANAIQSSNAGGYDAFVVRVSSTGSSIEMGTYLGGTGSDSVYGIAVDASGNAYVAGQTLSTDFPTIGPIQIFPLSPAATFVGKLQSPSAGLRFMPVTPCRAVDTRNPPGLLGGPAIAGGTHRDFAIPASACGVPPNAQAYSLNITAVPGPSLGYLTIWASGQAQPNVSTLNSLDGRIKAAAVIVPAGNGGAISVFASDTSNVLVDVNGYFVSASVAGALSFYLVSPCRIVDTRSSAGPLAGPSLGAGQTRTFPILSGTCAIPETAQAYSLNFTAIPSGPLGYISTWPTGKAQPTVSTLNALTGSITANAAVVPAGFTGSIEVVATNNTDLLIDVSGYFAPAGAGGLSLYSLPACRVLDTRFPTGSPPISGTNDIHVAGSCDIPTVAQAFVLNATVVPSGSLGFLTLWPRGQGEPGVSTLNALDGAITSNLAIVPSASGWISAFLTQPSHLLLDTSGYFAP